MCVSLSHLLLTCQQIHAELQHTVFVGPTIVADIQCLVIALPVRVFTTLLLIASHIAEYVTFT